MYMLNTCGCISYEKSKKIAYLTNQKMPGKRELCVRKKYYAFRACRSVTIKIYLRGSPK